MFTYYSRLRQIKLVQSSRCIDEGKATIRLIEPPVDINLQGDKLQIKSFLNVLKLCLQKKYDPAILNLSNLTPKILKATPKTTLVIKKKSDYPVLEGFPRITVELHIVNLQRKSFDRQILKLQSLRVLNLSENLITSLPAEVGNLPHLQELYLADNQLGKSPISKWTWMNGINISRNLRLLNLCSNQIFKVPDQIGKLHGLVSLYLTNNKISALPQGIGNLKNLKFLMVAKNKLLTLPGSMKNIRLSELDVSDNAFQMRCDSTLCSSDVKVPSLVDLTARVVVKKRMYYDASIIPYTLVCYIDKANYCLCGMPCFGSFIQKFMPVNLSDITNAVKFTDRNDVLLECYFCSIKCCAKYYSSS
ncbi:leucine-rich repeat protein 1-like isoform X2 [Phymastichus coffea]|uniref:leucine-rich repeat protein 1-like isoform X2 n=1 Tax=Phymastichus coffea TaxID=108790 RepID=UPI00273A782F|nr:leucine-rich repeat protein 1-like isoform X2 [Phymastichus coffea]